MNETAKQGSTFLELDSIRLAVNKQLDPKNKSKLGQFMTPSNIADYMASLFDQPTKPVKLIDCGAGIGSLTVSAIQKLKPISLIDTWEIDPIMREHLELTLKNQGFPYSIHSQDFIDDAASNIQSKTGSRFTHAIINPPYKKINSNSPHRLTLRKIGIETVNLYTAFLALTILLMENEGQIVAIIPRSFCNGPYYKPFRKLMLSECSIEHIHVFESRNKAFKDDEVLQENIIIKLIKGKKQENVSISISHDQKLSDYAVKELPFQEIVKEKDEEYFVHIPTEDQSFDETTLFRYSLKELNLEVSTGPVVDFRLKEHWLQEPTAESIPIIYSHHFVDGELQHPKTHKKPNALRPHPEVSKWLMPNGNYVLVKRFSSKEERRRVVAHIVKPADIKNEYIGFENHWNVFHFKKKGIDPIIVKGLVCFLNSTELDNYFRVFSGHTQVNATDLKNMKYPSLATLKKLGESYDSKMNQEKIDQLISEMI